MDFFEIWDCAAQIFDYVRLTDVDAPAQTATSLFRRPKMTRDELNRELRMHSASWPAVLIVYGLIVATMVFSAMSIT
ncbi:hypothetical protein [Roseovarius sp.]|jgi:hypothetical protein